MPLVGRQLSIRWALALCYYIGWRRNDLTTAVAVMTAESGRYTAAYHDNTNGSQDRGLFQINSIHGSNSTFDVIKNSKFAYQLSKAGDDWTPWSAYNSGSHKKYILEILAVKMIGRWRRQVNRIETEFG